MPTCTRCGGLLVVDHGVQFSQSMAYQIDDTMPSTRCLNCGDVIDEVILRNRLAQREAAFARMQHDLMVQVC